MEESIIRYLPKKQSHTIIFMDCNYSAAQSGIHLRRLFLHSAAIMLSCKLTMYSCNASHACMLSNFSFAPTLRYVAIIIDGLF